MALSKPLEALVNANSGAWAGLWATLFIAPVDSIKVELQSATGETSKGIIATLIQKFNDPTQGPSSLYSGVTPKAGWSMVGKWFFYGAYFLLTTSYENIFGKKPDFFRNLILASLSDLCHVPISAPLEKISTQCIKKKKSPGEVISELYNSKEQNKPTGIWAFLPNPVLYLWLSLSPALTNTIFTQVKTYFLQSRGRPNGVLGAAESFVLGAIARAIATLVIFPFIRCKIVMQSEGNMPIKKCLKTIVRGSNGRKALYYGLNAELIRGVISSAITLMLKERSLKMNRNLIIWVATFLKNTSTKSTVPV